MTRATPRIELRPISALRPYPGNARTHSRKQIRQIAASIRRFGFTNPVLISDSDEIIAGHGRVRAAKELGLTEAPTIRLSHLSAQERRAYVLADNKLAANASWDAEILAIEFQALISEEFDLTYTGFSPAEVDLTLDFSRERKPEQPDLVDVAIEPPRTPVTRQGDLWRLGRHRLICGDARARADLGRLLAGDRADMIFTDPPYNVAIDGNVCGKGAVRHSEFVMASGEMTSEQFVGFLTATLGNGAAVCRDGAIAFVCMDWRHMRELLQAGGLVFSELKNLCVWNKTNGGMGAFYRSKHELVFVFKVGLGPHTNNFGLGETGRPRTNVWDYPGVSSMGARRAEALAMHPTVKPVALVADAIKDCSHRGEVILDLFGGSGTTLIAAETCGRSARLMEFDPAYCDVTLARWRKLTGDEPQLFETGEAFDDVEARRLEAVRHQPEAASAPQLQTEEGRAARQSSGGRRVGKTKRTTER